MIIIGLTQQVENDAELKALTGLNNQDFIWHNGQNAPFMYRSNVSTGTIQSDNGGWFIKENLRGLNFEEHKQHRINEVNERTGEIVAQGYTYNGIVFPLSQNAQINLLGLLTAKDGLTYPVELNSLDDSQRYNIVDAADVVNLYMTALATKKAALDSGTILKEQIESCTTDAEINAITDNR